MEKERGFRAIVPDKSRGEEGFILSLILAR
jgi:hypothetical protein